MFNEKTWPTSMVIAAITWNLNQPRMPKNIRFNAFRFLDGLIRLAATTGKFNITVQTELPGVLGMHILHWKYITFWSDPFFNEFEIWHDKFSNISMHRMEQWVSCFFFNSIIRFHCKQGLAPLLTFTLPSNHFFPLVWLISGPPDGPGRNPNPVFNAWASDLNESCLNHPWIDNFDKRFQIRTHYDEV